MCNFNGEKGDIFYENNFSNNSIYDYINTILKLNKTRIYSAYNIYLYYETQFITSNA